MTVALLAASSNVNVNVSGLKSPSSAVLIIIAITVLAIAPAILILMTGFTRVFIVLSLTRKPFKSTSVCAKEEPRIEISAWAPPAPRSSINVEGSDLMASSGIVKDKGC